jgi:hypothetical protein
MDGASTIRLLNELEEEFPVASWMLAGVHVWPIVRGELYWVLNDDFSVSRTRVRTANPVQRRVRQLIERPGAATRLAGTPSTARPTR